MRVAKSYNENIVKRTEIRAMQIRKCKEWEANPNNTGQDRKSIRREGGLLHAEYTGCFIPGPGNILEWSLCRRLEKKREFLASALESLLAFNLVVPTVLTQSDLCSNPDYPNSLAVWSREGTMQFIVQTRMLWKGGVINDFTRAT